MYKAWCEKSHHTYKERFTLTDVLETLPVYTTTGVSEPGAVLRLKTSDNAALKGKFQRIFEREWKSKKAELEKKYGIVSYEAVLTNGTEETRNASDFSKSGKGGLRIIFFDKDKNPKSFMWMRGSGTEPVFRILCDVKGDAHDEERMLIEWETKMLKEADKA